MILIVVKFPVKPERAEEFIAAMGPVTTATRAEPGNKWYEWSREMAGSRWVSSRSTDKER